MAFFLKEDKIQGEHSLGDLKIVYRTLHTQLRGNLELMDLDFLLELQNFLQKTAGEDGVDVTNHGEWDSWLKDKG